MLNRETNPETLLLNPIIPLKVIDGPHLPLMNTHKLIQNQPETKFLILQQAQDYQMQLPIYR